MNEEKIDSLGQKIGEAALRTLVRLVPNIREVPNDRLEAACAAMRATAKGAVEQLLADAKAAPWLAEMAFTSAVLSVAQAGAAVLRDQSADADPAPPAGTEFPEARVSPEDQKRIDASAAGYVAGKQAAPCIDITRPIITPDLETPDETAAYRDGYLSAVLEGL
jgi:hypothetical protein